MVVQVTVNHKVAGSSPAEAVNLKKGVVEMTTEAKSLELSRLVLQQILHDFSSYDDIILNQAIAYLSDDALKHDGDVQDVINVLSNQPTIEEISEICDDLYSMQNPYQINHFVA